MGSRGAYWSGATKDYQLREFDSIGLINNGTIKVIKRRENAKNIRFPIYSNTPNTTYFVVDAYNENKIDAIGIYRNNKIVESIDLLDTRGVHWHKWTSKIYKKDGKEVNYSKYDDGSITYYKGNTILMSENADGTIIYYDSVKNSAPSGFFAPPAGYTSKPLNAANIQEFSELIGGTKSE